MVKRFLSLLALTLSLGSSGLLYSTELPTPNNFGGNFKLDSTLGETAELSDWSGELVLLNFGFTSCPDVCPMILSKLSLVQKQLDADAKKIQVLFVSVDPERDNLEKIKNYLQHYHKDFVGMRTDTEAEVKALMKRYGAVVESHKTSKGKEISHSDYVYLVNRQGYVAGFYDIKMDYKDLISAIEKHL